MNNLNNISEAQLTAIDRYLDSEMTAAERLEFDTKLNVDPIFKGLVDEVRQLRLGIESAVLKEQLNDFHEEMVPVRTLETSQTNSNKKSKIRSLIPLSIAASVVAAIGIFMFMNQGSANEKLFAKHFKADPGLPTVMSTSNQFEFYDAMVSYKQENYAEAIEKWEAILPIKPENDTLNFYLGVSYLAEGNIKKASQFFDETLKNSESIFTENAYYFSALAEIKNGNIENAKTLLKKSGSQKSNALLKELNK